MDHRIDPTGQNPVEQVRIADIAAHEPCSTGHGPVEPGGEIVEDDYLLAHLKEVPDHVAADVPGTSRHQN